MYKLTLCKRIHAIRSDIDHITKALLSLEMKVLNNSLLPHELQCEIDIIQEVLTGKQEMVNRLENDLRPFVTKSISE